MNQYALMARFNAWANQRLYDTVAKLTDADYRKDRKAFFGSIHNTLNHLMVGDRVWLARLEGKESGVKALAQILYDDFKELRRARATEDERFIRIVDSYAASDLQRPITFRRLAGGGAEKTLRVESILLTLLNHQTHHRGQVHAMLTAAGITPPPMDVIDYMGEAGIE